MWIAYLDESGIDPRSRSVVVSGFVGTGLTWARFEYDWRSVLGSFGVTAFHERLVRSRLHQADRANAFRDELLDVIETHDIFGIAAGVLAGDYQRLISDSGVVSTKGLTEDQWRHPYYLAFQFAVVYSLQRTQLPRQEPLLYVLDQHPVYQDRTQEIHSAMRRHTEWENHARVGTLEFRSSKDTLPLQAADYLASHIRRDLDRLVHRPEEPQPRRMRRLQERLLGARYLNAAAITGFLALLEDNTSDPQNERKA